MSNLTRQDIDVLVAHLATDEFGYKEVGQWVVSELDLTSALYLAAGLNADGSEKAKVVRATVWVERQSPDAPAYPAQSGTGDGTTFTPDGAA